MSNDSAYSLLDAAGIAPEQARTILADAANGADDGEIFIEDSRSESLVFDNGRLKQASFDTGRGFGMRAVTGESAAYAHSTEVTPEALKRAAATVSAVSAGHGGSLAMPPASTNVKLYDDIDPTEAPEFAAKTALLGEIDSWVRARDSRVRQVTVSLAGSRQAIEILRPDGRVMRDQRPMVRLNVSVVAGEGDRQETGSYGLGGRTDYERWIAADSWQMVAEEALRQALVNLEAQPAPAGELDVVLGPGWPGILLHEAVGHGLEGDFNRKGQSAFAGLMGERVAAPGVTVIDEGTIAERRGSLTIDDEGTPTSSTTLIEDGILVGYMQDRQNARLMGHQPTGNGRRQSYAHIPMPRMTNTIMQAGPHDPEEILAGVRRGLYAKSFGGGQVDITSGKFVFSCTEAYLIENGRLGAPVKGAMLIGNGPDALTRVRMVGNDMALDPGIGTCGKNGQGVPVGVGQPTIRIDAVTVGGTSR